MKGVLLINLGTPDSPNPHDVKKYLIEFLTDGRVIDVPWVWRHLLVRGRIVPKRYKQSALSYKSIWTDEGSPLMLHSKSLKEKLQAHLGDQYKVELAMRYQNPNLEKTLNHLNSHSLKELIILPLFPQYASATTGSIHQKIMGILSRYETIPPVRFINSYADHPALIEAFYHVAQDHLSQPYDHYLFSFHGLPERQLKKANDYCLKTEQCCQNPCQENTFCYASQCYRTMQSLAKRLNLEANQYSICFQSRLGKDPWLRPYTSDVITKLARDGKRRILVFCPSFVCDCLETTYEIGVEYAEEFKHAGGQTLDLVPGLNSHPKWVEALAQLININD